MNHTKSINITTFVIVSVAYIFVLLMFMLFSNKLINLLDGLIICRSDCTDFHNLSTYFAENFSSPSEGDTHNSFYYRGFVIIVGLLKALFGSLWGYALVAFSGAVVACLGAVLAWKTSPKHFSWLFPGFILLCTANPLLMVYSKLLLTDFLFGIGATACLVFLSIGVGRKENGFITGAFAIQIAILFIRPHGMFLLPITLSIIFAYLLIKKWGSKMMVALPLLAGLSVMLIIATLTVFAQSFYDSGLLPQDAIVHFNIFLRANFYGMDESLSDLEAGKMVIKNFPLHVVYDYGGTFLGALGGFFLRFWAALQVALPDYSNAHNLARYAYYSTMYASFIGFVIFANKMRRLKPEYIILTASVLGYMLIFISFTPIEIRYLTPFNFIMIYTAIVLMSELINLIKNKISTNALAS